EQQQKAYDSLIGSIEERIARAEMEAQALGLPEDAARRPRIEFEILQQFKQAGITPDPAEVDRFVDRMMAAETATEKLTDAAAQQKKQMDQLRQSVQSVANSLLDMTGLSDTPFGMGISGALPGLLSGDIFGGLLGGILGVFNGFAKAAKEAEKARQALAKAQDDIDVFLRES